MVALSGKRASRYGSPRVTLRILAILHAMERLFPLPSATVSLDEVYGPITGGGDRPRLRLTMIASVDGATAVDGLSGGLGCPADQHLFQLNRSFADVILVAAGTMRAEGYGPAPMPPDLQADRRVRGQSPVPPIAVVSRSCSFDWDAPFFTEAVARPIVITAGCASEQHRSRAAKVADLVISGHDQVDLAAALETLGNLGFGSVAAEGGPSLNGALAQADLIDELCLTVSPRIVVGDSKRTMTGPALAAPAGMVLASACREGEFLFLRYERSPGA
jgi:riboflavin biosynthesis pyrimidine reductase